MKRKILLLIIGVCFLLASCGKDGQSSNNPSSLIIGDWLCVKMEYYKDNGELIRTKYPEDDMGKADIIYSFSFSSTTVQIVTVAYDVGEEQDILQYSLDSSTKELFFAGFFYGTIKKLTHGELVIDTMSGTWDQGDIGGYRILYFKKK